VGAGRWRYLLVVANEAEIRRWNDERWTAAWPERERLTAAVSASLLGEVDARPGQRVLEIGCGGGLVTMELAGAVAPGGSVVGVDVSAALLALAGTRIAQGAVPAITLARLDMQTAAVDGGPFDVAVSQFGVMFFDQPETAFRNVRRQMRPGGDLVFAAWQGVDRNPWHTGRALSGLVPAPPPPGPGQRATGPFTMGDVAETTQLLAAAGFVDIASRPYETTVDAPASAVVDPALFDFMGIPPERMAEAGEMMDRHLRQFALGPGVYRFPLAFHIYRAQAR
jgi:SAM-dependent methyltransferase